MRTIKTAIIILWLIAVASAKEWNQVKASREGLIGGTTASGLVIKADDLFVALPSRLALKKWVIVEYEDISIRVQVLDVGPWNTRDPYFYKGQRPQAETGKDLFGRKTNGTGIDLSDGLWDLLGIPRKLGIVNVRWKFE